MKNIIFLMGLITILSCNQKNKTSNRLGIVEFEVFGNELAQSHFEKGLLLLHSFEYDDSREEFIKAQEADPEMVMAFWGEAMTYNHSIWSEQDYENGYAVVEKINAMR